MKDRLSIFPPRIRLFFAKLIITEYSFFLSLAGHNPLGSVRHFLFNPGQGGFHKQGGSMINDVILEGIVVRDPWKFMDDLFFRLVIYRDSDLPAKKLDLESDAGDYINVRVNGGANGLIHIRRDEAR